jgi:hypothetical protein
MAAAHLSLEAESAGLAGELLPVRLDKGLGTVKERGPHEIQSHIQRGGM